MVGLLSNCLLAMDVSLPVLQDALGMEKFLADLFFNTEKKIIKTAG